MNSIRICLAILIFNGFVLAQPNQDVGRWQFVRFGEDNPGPTAESRFGKFDTVTGKLYYYDKKTIGTISTWGWNEVKGGTLKYNKETGEVISIDDKGKRESFKP